MATLRLLTRSIPHMSRGVASAPKLQPFSLPSRTPIKPARIFTRGLATPSEQPRIRIGSTAPDFEAQTTSGKIRFHDWVGNSWAILFSHPADFTPVCTTELGAFARLAGEFEARGVKMIGLSANGLESHGRWVNDINEVTGADVQFPIIADPKREVAWLYDMVSEEDQKKIETAFTIRSVFVIDPSKKVRLTMQYPASTGRNTAEVLRVVDALQTSDKKGVTTPIDWTVGQDVIVPPTVSTEDAKKKFGAENVRELKPYLRFTKI